MEKDIIYQTYCRKKGFFTFLTLPFYNLIAFNNIKVWIFSIIIYSIILLIVYKFVPCNSNLNCDTVSNQKDIYKSFITSTIIYIVFTMLTVLNAKYYYLGC